MTDGINLGNNCRTKLLIHFDKNADKRHPMCCSLIYGNQAKIAFTLYYYFTRSF